MFQNAAAAAEEKIDKIDLTVVEEDVDIPPWSYRHGCHKGVFGVKTNGKKPDSEIGRGWLHKNAAIFQSYQTPPTKMCQLLFLSSFRLLNSEAINLHSFSRRSSQTGSYCLMQFELKLL